MSLSEIFTFSYSLFTFAVYNTVEHMYELIIFNFLREKNSKVSDIRVKKIRFWIFNFFWSIFIVF